MTASHPTADPASFLCHVFDAADMPAVYGTNAGDPLGAPEDLCLGDVYAFDENAAALRLVVGYAEDAGSCRAGGLAGATVAEGSETGAPGDRILAEARLTFMSPDGARTEILLLSLTGAPGPARRVFVALSPVEPACEYTLVAASADPGPVALSDLVSVAFTRGTRITMADGVQRPVEEIRAGDLVLTRDNGPQPVRHVVARTVRAVGAYAPVAIRGGAFGNDADLVVSQHQRLFVYQSGTFRIADRSELLVRASDLVDGDAVRLRRGGHCDYYSLVFDRHELIYAECIPVESLLVNPDTLRNLGEETRADIAARLPGLSQEPLAAAETRPLPPEAIARLLKVRGRH